MGYLIFIYYTKQYKNYGGLKEKLGSDRITWRSLYYSLSIDRCFSGKITQMSYLGQASSQERLTHLGAIEQSLI